MATKAHVLKQFVSPLYSQPDHPMANATAVSVTHNGALVEYRPSDPSWTRQLDFGLYDNSRFAAIITPPTTESFQETRDLIKGQFSLLSLSHLPSSLLWSEETPQHHTITFTLLTNTPFHDTPRLFVLLAVCTDGSYRRAIEYVTRKYQPGIVLSFASAPDLDSNSVLITSSFTPKSHHMPPPLHDDMISDIDNAKLLDSNDQPLAHLSPCIRCDDIAQDQPDPTGTLSAVWRMFSFLNHSHADPSTQSPASSAPSNASTSDAPACAICTIIPVCALVPVDTNASFSAGDIIRAGLFAATPLFTSLISLLHIPVKLVEFSVRLNAGLDIDVSRVQTAMNNITVRYLGSGGGFFFHIGTRPGSIILDFVGSLSYVWALRAHLARNGGILDGMEVVEIVVNGVSGGPLSEAYTPHPALKGRTGRIKEFNRWIIVINILFLFIMIFRTVFDATACDLELKAMEQESVADTSGGGTALQSEPWVEKSARKFNNKLSLCPLIHVVTLFLDNSEIDLTVGVESKAIERQNVFATHAGTTSQSEVRVSESARKKPNSATHTKLPSDHIYSHDSNSELCRRIG